VRYLFPFLLSPLRDIIDESKHRFHSGWGTDKPVAQASRDATSLARTVVVAATREERLRTKLILNDRFGIRIYCAYLQPQTPLSVSGHAIHSLEFLLVVVRRVLETLGIEGSLNLEVRRCAPRAHSLTHCCPGKLLQLEHKRRRFSAMHGFWR
jgi:hypothetical protein